MEPDTDKAADDSRALEAKSVEDSPDNADPNPPAAPPTAAPGPAAPSAGAPQKQSLIIGLVIAAFIVGALVIAFATSSEPAPATAAAPSVPAKPSKPWKVGEKVDVALTVLPTDGESLACASEQEITGKHCAFKTTTTPREDASADDKILLKPYSTTGKERIIAAGLWSDPGMRGKLPAARFTVRCAFSIEGSIKAPGVRWGKTSPWRDMKNDWFAGTLSGCEID
jgi:hypothetical protein